MSRTKELPLNVLKEDAKAQKPHIDQAESTGYPLIVESRPLNYLIRLANDDDFEQVYAIWLDGIHNSFDYKSKDMKKIEQKFASIFFQRQGIFNFWIATDENNKILGWQSLIRTSNNPFRENIYAEASTYISKDNRYKGMGKALLDYVMQEAEKSDLEYITCFVSVANEAAKKITEETGWIEIGVIPASKKGENKFVKSFLIRPV